MKCNDVSSTDDRFAEGQSVFEMKFKTLHIKLHT